MDFGVWTNRFSGTTSGHWYTGGKSGYLDPASSVSACMLPVRYLSVDRRHYKANWDDIADVIHLAPCTGST